MPPARGYPVTDAQVHIWADDRPDRPWPSWGSARAHRFPAFTLDDLLREMDAAAVARAVLVPPSFEGDRNDVVLAAAERHPDRLAVMARFDPAADGAAQRLHALLDRPAVRGFRMTYHLPQMRAQLLAPAADWFWATLAAHRRPVMIYAPGLLPEVGRIGAAHPGLRIVVDTLGLSLAMRDDDLDAPIAALTALAANPDVAVKATALPAHVSDPYPFRSLAPRLRTVLDAFGAQRVFWASDLTRVPHPYRQIVDYPAELGCCTATELTWLMGRGISTWLDWPTE